MSAEDEARSASEAFYSALNRMANGDAGPLAAVWSHGSDVTTMHPIGGRQLGWDAVRESFAQVARIASEGHISLDDRIARVVGDVAWEVGAERGTATFAGQRVALDHRVTNVYRREAGGWRVVHHHTDLSPAMLDVLKRLQGAA